MFIIFIHIIVFFVLFTMILVKKKKLTNKDKEKSGERYVWEGLKKIHVKTDVLYPSYYLNNGALVGMYSTNRSNYIWTNKTMVIYKKPSKVPEFVHSQYLC